MSDTRHWCFGPFRLDPTTRSLWRDGVLLPLPPKPFAVLAYLVTHAGQVVAKETLLAAVWPDTAVTEGVLKTCLGQIRQVLGETARTPQYIATFYRRGYRFVAPVTVVDWPATPPSGAPLPRAVSAPRLQAALAETIRTSRAVLAGERKHVTVLFADLPDSLALIHDLDPEAAQQLLDPVLERLMAAVQRYEGTVNQVLGDGIMALFGAPMAQEDHAVRACYAALAMQTAVGQYAEEVRRAQGRTIQLRVGLNSGEVVVRPIGNDGHMDYSAMGPTTHLAARMEQLARPGTTLLTRETLRLVAGLVQVTARGPVPIRGVLEPVEVFELVGASARRGRFHARVAGGLTRFVGRQHELESLRRAVAQVEAGQGQVVGVVGEAGQGKSRLLYEFRQRLPDKRMTYLEGRCLSYGSTMPYHPLIDLLRHNCGITETDSPGAILGKVHCALHEVGMDAEDAAPYLLQLLGVQEGTASVALFTPEAIRTRTFETLTQMSLKGSQHRPLIVAIEDLHWIDKTSEAYLAALVERVAGAAMLVLTTSRPGYRPPWIDKSYATQLSLHPLTPQDSVLVVHSTCAHGALPAPLEQMIVAKADGNPFFLEELTRAVLAQGDPLTALTVPDTVQGVLMARMDRLPDALKRLVQTAAILGREFSPRLLAAIWDGPDPLAPLLAELQRLEFVLERTGVDEPLVLFKHTLTQEVAYASMLTPRRQGLHAAAGEALERLYADRLADAYDRLAYHYARTDNLRKALDYLLRSAAHAARHYAHTEAVTALEQALLQGERLPAIEQDRPMVEVLLRLAPSLYFLGRFPESLAVLLQHRDRVDRVHDPRLSGPYYFWLGHTYSYLGEQPQAIHYAHHALDWARQCADHVTMGKAYYLLARDDGYWAGQCLRGIAHSRKAIAALAQTDERWWLGQSYWVLGVNYWMRGDFLLALEAETHTQHIGEALGDPRLQTYAAWTTGLIYSYLGDYDQGIAACQRSLQHSPDPLNTVMTTAYLGYNYLQQGNLVQARPLLEHAMQRMAQFRFQQLYSWYMTWVADAYLQEGHPEVARDLARQSVTIAREGKFWFGVGAAQRTLGRIAHRSGDVLAARSSLHDALATYASIQARFELARTHLDLASVAHTQGHQDTATTHLSTAYAWFKTLQVPKWMARTEHLAQEYGVTLTEVALEVPEGPP